MRTAEAVGRVDVAELADSMRRTGFGVVPNALSPDELQELQAYARESVRRNGNEATYLPREALLGTTIGDLGASPEMKSLLARLYEEAVKSPAASREVVHPALRCLYGRSGAASSLQFHFDSYMVTALLPIAIPTVGNPGDLLYFPNLRGARKRALVNVIDKAICQNPLGTRLISSKLGRSVFKPRRQELVPENLYVFWGYQTLHGNDRCDRDQLRATALFHFGDPHLTDPLVQLIQRRVHRKVKLPAAQGEVVSGVRISSTTQ